MAVVIQRFIRSTLSEEYFGRKSKNPSFSIRAFAKRLGVSPSTLSEVLQGKRRVSRKLALQLSEKLCLDPKRSQKFMKSVQEIKNEPDSLEYTSIDQKTYQVISEWHHFAILSLTETSDFREDADWIASRLNISPSKVRAALNRLLEMKLLVRDSQGKLKQAEMRYSTSDGIFSTAVRAAHHVNLDLARQSLDNDELNQRDFTSLTLAFNFSKMKEAKEMIRKFQDQFSEKFEQEGTEVYKLCVQLIPLSSSIDRKKGKS